MTSEVFAVVVVIVANALTFTMLLPQVGRLLQTGLIEGVSAVWAATGTVINVGWLAYVLHAAVWLAIPSIAAAVLSYSLTLYLLFRNGADVRIGLVTAALLAAALVGVQAVAGWTLLGTALAMANGVQFAPSVRAAWHAQTPAGVSPLTWLITEAEAVLWALYGVLIADVPIVLFGVTASAAATAILFRLWLTRDRVRAARQAAL